ncbi:hypothetical protein ARMGADRAFT_1048243 [Armillaria gallica]|uniref:Uncharacterized protein n=1 Tax=Armillaria gallica TaxID=47427 RepID=A0A2H3DAR2_ARMGA|nr:hypothetical protein ARMGADRAFT_1048243 [Armillaria gallica]
MTLIPSFGPHCTVEELLLLAVGVPVFDAASGEAFLLRAYLILIFRDMPAMSMVMHFKGHNGFCPCCSCNITGIGDPGNPCAHTLYIPLDCSHHPAVHTNPSMVTKYDPANLPLQTDREILQQAQEVQFQVSPTASNNIGKKYGIKGTSILSSLLSISFTQSFPHDFMHLVFENVLTLLTLLWTGQFKGLNEGTESYQFPSDVWDAIGQGTAAAGLTIPGAFGQHPPNVATNKTACTADLWCFWLLYIAPVLLSHKFDNAAYFNHFIALVKLVNICLQFEISHDEVATVHQGFIDWVEEYER